MKKLFLLCIILVFFLPKTMIAQESALQENRQLVDRIVAVIGDQIILMSEVRRNLSAIMMARNMDENTPPNILESLFREVLQDMVNERLLLVKADQDSILPDLQEVDQLEKDQLAQLRSQYPTDDEFNRALGEFGLTEQQLRSMIRQMQFNYLVTETLKSEIASYNTPTPQEMEAWIAANKDSLPEMPEELKISHILMYSKVSDTKRDTVRSELEDILARIRAGEDFAELAKQYSQDPGSSAEGGDLGYFTRDLMISEFSDVAFALDVGEVSDVFESQFGYHIIKVEDIKGERVSARHILMLLNPDESDDTLLVDKLNEIRNEIISGSITFEDAAKLYSEDADSRDLGGKIQWLTREQGIPSFIDQGEKLEIGEISEPFMSQFGYHIIQLDGHRPAHTINIKDDNQIIRQLVTQQKTMAELDRILEKLKQETYISIRLE